MRYSHQWYQKRSFTRAEFDAIITESKRVVGASMIAISGPDGTGPAVLGPRLIALNGTSGTMFSQSCEPFILERVPTTRIHDPADGHFAFCKTEHCPYDSVVVSILHFARTLAPDAIRVESDGKDAAIRTMY